MLHAPTPEVATAATTAPGQLAPRVTRGRAACPAHAAAPADGCWACSSAAAAAVSNWAQLGFEENVAGLEVPVNDALAVQVVHGVCDTLRLA
jgi:hypothetical protein